ncbi:hypothetical protein QCH01_18700 [Raoultella ornithinolytica]|nr:hypothetical protein [Raoultella ornithinolytica]EKV8772333.1 hypothetical protein [Klebsiella variicola]EKW0520331.1 hypothetical protein [Klebsiella variicola]
MSLVPVEAFVKGFSKNYTFSSVDDGEITNLNINDGHPVNPSFMINVPLKNMNDTHLSALTPDMLNSSKKESESESIETESFLLEKFKRISMEYASHKAIAKQANSNFVPIRDCYGVVDDITQNGQNTVFEARIYQNTSNEFIEVIRAPISAFKQSDAELLNVGSVFYWKAGYRSTDKGTRVKVNEFNLRRIIREKSVIRKKRVDQVVDELLSIFK